MTREDAKRELLFAKRNVIADSYIDQAYDMAIKALSEPEKETAKRVIWTGWKGYRDTRYKCPNCKKPVKNDDVYCHRCGQKLMFPHISWTDYVEGQKQELIVRWDDDQSELQPDTEQGT